MRSEPVFRQLMKAFLLAVFWALTVPASPGANLKPETLKAWQVYADATEHRIAQELSSERKFLAQDFQAKIDPAADRQALYKGDLLAYKMESRNSQGEKIQVPEGMIHHWGGSVFIPGVDLAFVFSRVADPTAQEIRQEDVLQSKVLVRKPGYLRLFLKLQRSKIVTVVYNTEHEIQYQRRSENRAWSNSKAVKIAELANPNSPEETEKPQGQDRGFLWRLNSYWRYEQTNGGVIVECESISLSRALPKALQVLIRPIIDSVAKESMQRTLESLRERILLGSRGRQEGMELSGRGISCYMDLLPKMQVNIILSDHNVEKAVETIIEAARTGKKGDGLIIIYPVEFAIRIRTGERGADALMVANDINIRRSERESG